MTRHTFTAMSHANPAQGRALLLAKRPGSLLGDSHTQGGPSS